VVDMRPGKAACGRHEAREALVDGGGKQLTAESYICGQLWLIEAWSKTDKIGNQSLDREVLKQTHRQRGVEIRGKDRGVAKWEDRIEG
jgi:hypothetical protein